MAYSFVPPVVAVVICAFFGPMIAAYYAEFVAQTERWALACLDQAIAFAPLHLGES